MSSQIPTAMIEQFKANIDLLSQKQGSVLENAVRRETVSAENAFFDQIGATEVQEKTGRHAPTPQIDTPHSRRMVTPRDFNWADYIDRLDKLKLLNDPQSEYAVNAVYSMGRKKDEIIIDAMFGTAYTGKKGTTAVTLPSSQEVAVNISGSNTGLTIAKLRAARSILKKNHVDHRNPLNKFYIAVTQQQIDDLLAVTQTTSSDYAAVKALVDGEISYFMGFEFLQTELMPLDAGTDIRTCCAYAKSGICFGVAEDTIVRSDERADLSYTNQIYVEASFGATRMEEEKVVAIYCDESP